MFENELKLSFFLKNGFVRKVCRKCNTPFWTLKGDSDTCGDSPCTEYAFIGKPITKKSYSLDEMRQTFISYFAERGHTPLDRYPVIARWRNDIYLTIASIADFQPHVTSGISQPPANPLVISQPCIRLVDIMSVGKSGKHLSNFEMMAHHAFNDTKRTIYWKEETTAYCHELMTKYLGIEPTALTYKESPWSGGGNAGPALEVLAGGLEISTLVFMNLKSNPNGFIKVHNELYSLMPLSIVDTGYGLERMVWVSKGTPTIYDAIYPDITKELFETIGMAKEMTTSTYKNILTEYAKLAGIIDITTTSNVRNLREALFLKLKAKGQNITLDELVNIMTPIENVYAITDHTRCLALMLSDGIVPSNVRAGYLARLVIRKTLRHMNELGIKTPLSEVVIKQIENYGNIIKRKDVKIITKILQLETERYNETIQKGEKLVKKLGEKVGKGGKLTTDNLIELYDTHGIPPNIVERVCKDIGVQVDIPDAFMSILAEKHAKVMEEKAPEVQKYDFPATKTLYYENGSGEKEFDAVVLYSKDSKIILDQTSFFPNGGGQPCDVGVLVTDDKTVEVKEVQKVGDVIVHIATDNLEVGEIVHGHIDWNRRLQHTRHHTATHIILGSAKGVLGSHAWQAGSQIEADRARVDITHYDKITDSELRKIGLLANMVVMEGLSVEALWMARNEAEKKYGSVLYQGGVPEGEKIRVVRIADFDVEACGGTQCTSTNEIGPIKILKCYSVQDGIERIEFSAGTAAVRDIQEREALLKSISDIFRVPPEQLLNTLKKFFEDWKSVRKENDNLKQEIAKLRSEDLRKKAEDVGGIKIVYGTYKTDMNDLLSHARELTRDAKTIAVLGSDKDDGKLIVARGAGVNIDCGEIAKDVAQIIGGSGGGKPDIGQCGGQHGEKINDAVMTAIANIKKRLIK
jgi:alanyl-tRNA synthetase